jgi:hypothetical protein
VYKYSKQAVRVNLGTVVSLLILLALFAVIGGSITDRTRGYSDLILFLATTLLNGALVFATVSGVRQHKVSLGDAIGRGTAIWWRMILLTLLCNITYVVSLTLLVIPFLFVYPRLSLATYFLVDKNMGVLGAYKASWRATKSHAIKPWGIIGVTALIAVLMLTIIGIPFSIYFYVMYNAAYAVLYEMLQTAQPAGAPVPPVDTPPAPPTVT